MPLQKIQFRPGIVRDLTSYTTEGGWYDCNLVRFRLTYPQSIGGWQKLSNNTYLGVCRSLLGWNTLGGQFYVGVGTTLKFYIENSGLYYDVTPIRATASLTSPFTAIAGSKVISVYSVGHNATLNDFVTYSGATGLGGNITEAVLNKEYQITKIVDGNNYQITAAIAANSSDTGHGGSVSAAYQIDTGLDFVLDGAGWGASVWGGTVAPYNSTNIERGWNTSSVLVAGNTLRLWSQATWGENLFFNVRNGGIYYWVSGSGLTNNRAVALSSLSSDSTVPTLATQVMLSDQDRHLIAFGANSGPNTTQDAMIIRWCTSEDYSVWYPVATNSAGDLRVNNGSHIVKAIKTKREILVFTDVAVYSMQFIGPPYTFGINQVGANITTSGYNAFVAVDDIVFWMGQNKFYVYSGTPEELVCPIKEYVFDNMNISQFDKVYAAINSEFNEVTWFYPSINSTENDSYVTYNYTDKAWTYGTMPRTAWFDRGVLTYPIAASPDGYLYNHEIGTDDGSTNPPTALNAYIQSSPVTLGSGDHFTFVKKLIPDVTFVNSTSSNPSVTMTFKVQNFPGSNYSTTTNSPVTQTATVPVEQFTEQAFMRLRGRQLTFRVGSNQVGTRWILGTPRVEIQPDGRR